MVRKAAAAAGVASSTWKAAIVGAGVLAGALSIAAAPGCGGDEGAVLLGGKRVSAAEIDADPLALLPSGIIMLSYLDAATLFSSKLGPDVSQLVTGLFPLGRESNFVPSRDVVKVYGGLYAMQGADFCVVLQGTFDEQAIRTSAETRAVTLAGTPLIRSRYADTDLFTAGNVGFVILTSHTILSGNETGIRRALDRLRYGKLERSMPSWMTDLVATKNAAFAVAGDFSAQPAVDAAGTSMPFVTGLRRVRVIGNFQPPGMNFAGALTYADPQSAANGASALANLQQLTSFVSMLSSWGMGGPVPPMKVAQSVNDVAFTLPLDESVVRILLRLSGDAARKVLGPK
jgi:hypothetical protein